MDALSDLLKIVTTLRKLKVSSTYMEFNKFVENYCLKFKIKITT